MQHLPAPSSDCWTSTEIMYNEAGRYRTLLTTQEFEKQGRECTKGELKKASLYGKHLSVVTLQTCLDRLKQVDRKVLIGVAVGLCAVLLTLIGCLTLPRPHRDSDGGLVPLTFPQRVLSIPLEFVELIRELTGTSRKGLPHPEEGAPVLKRPYQSGPRVTHSGGARDSNATATASRENERHTEERDLHEIEEGTIAPEFKDEKEGITAALIAEQSPFSFFRPRMNILSFAYSTACDFASAIYELAFGAP